ncbi:MAG: EAL domain-containing protein [Gammaproteobacteria bacterium]|nr:EAL domain-containing protein [Gammaproteobacteria bacterium]
MRAKSTENTGARTSGSSLLPRVASRRGINFRLLRFIVGISALFTVLTTGIQLYVEYQRDLNLQNQRITAMDMSLSPSLTLGVWVFDTERVMVLMNGILSSPDIYSTEINIINGDAFRVGPEVTNGNLKTRVIELIHADSALLVGILTLHLDQAIHYQQARDRVLLILATKSLQTFIVSFCIWFLVEFVVTRHLGRISKYLAGLRIGQLDVPLTLDRKSGRYNDELDTVVDAINDMTQMLRNDLEQIRQANIELQSSEKKFRNLYDTMAQGVVYQDGEGNIVSINRAAIKMLGLRSGSSQSWDSFKFKWHAPVGTGAPISKSPAMEALRTGKTVKNALVSIAKPNAPGNQWLIVNSTPQTQPEDNAPSLVYSTLTDITALKHTESELRKLHRAVESSSVMVVITNVGGFIEYINPRFTEITGYSIEEIVDHRMNFLSSGEHPAEFFAELWGAILEGNEWHGEIRSRKKDGSLYWDRTTISQVRDPTGKVTNYVAIKEDITVEYELAQRLTHQASHDALTGLINRSEFEQRVSRLISTLPTNQNSHAMCFMDLDQFKIINDTCGHFAGDELLRQVAKLLQNIVRKRDTLARLGGDEFGVLMEHCELNQATRVAEEILQAIKEYQFFWEGDAFRIGVSIGLVAVTESTGNYIELFKQADSACYLAKDQGRNRIHVYQPEDIELAARQGEMQWVGRINQALDEDRFCFFAQPIISVKNNERRYFELLLRMRDEQGSVIPPGSFLSAAERYDIIEKVDVWVFNHACALLAKHPEFVSAIDFVSINISGPSLSNENFLATIQRDLKESGISPRKICMEITETNAISNLKAATSFMSTMKKAGCRFALDDFGSGLSSFGYLKNLSVDYLKIDGMFVRDIAVDPIDRAMVKSINEIAHVMGIETIAEFVEDREIMDVLREIGVDYGQGYYLGEPNLLDELLELPLSKVSLT